MRSFDHSSYGTYMDRKVMIQDPDKAQACTLQPHRALFGPYILPLSQLMLYMDDWSVGYLRPRVMMQERC